MPSPAPRPIRATYRTPDYLAALPYRELGRCLVESGFVYAADPGHVQARLAELTAGTTPQARALLAREHLELPAAPEWPLVHRAIVAALQDAPELGLSAPVALLTALTRAGLGNPPADDPGGVELGRFLACWAFASLLLPFPAPFRHSFALAGGKHQHLLHGPLATVHIDQLRHSQSVVACQPKGWHWLRPGWPGAPKPAATLDRDLDWLLAVVARLLPLDDPERLAAYAYLAYRRSCHGERDWRRDLVCSWRETALEPIAANVARLFDPGPPGLVLTPAARARLAHA